MARKPTNSRKTRKPGGSRYAALALLSLIILAVGAYQVFKPGGTPTPPATPVIQPAPTPAQKTRPLPPVAGNYSAPATTPPRPQLQPKASVLPEGTPAAGTSAASGRLAIIIDDMGSSMQEARSLAGIGVPLTFAIIPGLHSYREVAAFAASGAIETMIHIPMQAKEWPERRLESNGLLVSMDDAAIGERMEEFMRNLPKAVGANNHMGSEFTEHEDKMRVVLTALKGSGLYFVDSVTSPLTVGTRLAGELDMRAARRSVFLDNEQNGAYIQGQLNQAVRLARKKGGVIAICHPHPATIRTLQAALPGLARQGITLVTASELVR